MSIFSRSSLAALVFFGAVPASLSQVSIREEKMTIPTWEIGPPAIHSMFPNRTGPIYPYTLNETLTERKVPKDYNAVVLENEFIKVLVLPEIGGRLHGAIDKTNNYVWLYWQPTIKPGLISMTGAWISGGIEWNFPHGHRPSGFMPVDHRIVRHADGSATAWVGETEPVYRMRWLVGMTIYPGKSYVRCDYIFINPTNLKHPFQFWATAATHANEFAQAQYPGDMVTGHGKHEFWNWPINDGVDLTWWKNVPNASSFFAFNNPSDWFGTYDHKAQGGMVHVADHHVFQGKKLWTWGSGPSGRIWEDILSEGGGAYFEPQAGAWSDNQPDYHWMAPNEVRRTHDFWYPVRDTRGYHNATEDFAVNTDLKDGSAFAGVYSTGIAKQHRVVLRDMRSGQPLLDAVVDISPDRPFTQEVKAPAGITVHDLRLEVLDSGGKLRIALQQHPPKEVELPPGQKDPGDPAKMNQDELFHSGEWLEKFVREQEGLRYLSEALRKDPGDSRVNAELGYIALNQGRWSDALKALDKALARDYDNSRLHFGKGMAEAGLGNLDAATDAFWRATYTYDCFSAAHLNLARLSLGRGDWQEALERLDDAASQNGRLADIPALQAAAYRRLGKPAKALAAANTALELDPMHFMGGREKILAEKALGKAQGDWAAEWVSIMRGATQNYLELAVYYANAGLYADADELLASLSEGKKDTDVYPMTYYLRGYYRELTGDAAGARDFRARAMRGPAVYTNPHRLEEKAALEAALEVNPKDSRAHLYLGNLLYAMGRREEGFDHWKSSVENDPGLSLAWRNVAYAQNQLLEDPRAAWTSYQKTLALAPDDGRALLEADQVAEALEMPATERLAFLEKYPSALGSRDDVTARWIDLRLEAGGTGDAQLAYDKLRSRDFRVWEGGYGIHDSWVDANQKLGDLAMERHNYEAALKHYQEECEYPRNLQVAPRTPDFRAHVYWNLVRVYTAMGQKQQADQYIGKILDEKYPQPQLGTFYQALARRAQGDESAYESLLDSVEKQAREYTSGKYEYRGNRETIGYQLLALVLEQKGDRAGAEAARKKAQSLNPLAMRAAIRSAQIEYARAHQ